MIPLIYIFIRRASDQPFIHFLIIVILTIGKRGGKQRRVTGHTVLVQVGLDLCQ